MTNLFCNNFFIFSTPMEINLIESGLIKKQYHKKDHILWLKQTTWKKIGGYTVWISPDSTETIIMYYDDEQPIIMFVNDNTEIEIILNQLQEKLNTIKNLIVQEKPAAITQTVSTFYPGTILSLLEPKINTYGAWTEENMEHYNPASWNQIFKIVLSGTKHCQFIINSNIIHAVFLHANTPDGPVLAGSSNSISLPSKQYKGQTLNQTSFDLTLTHGIYYLRAHSWNFEGSFSVIMHDDCENELERPMMYDDNNNDAFGNENPDIPQKIDFTENCWILSDNAVLSVDQTTNILTNSMVSASNGLLMQFSHIKIELSQTTSIRRIKIAGNQNIADLMINSQVVFYGGNNLSGPWENICTLNENITTPEPGTVDWVLDYFMNDPAQNQFQYYKIQFAPEINYDIALSEIELYD